MLTGFQFLVSVLKMLLGSLGEAKADDSWFTEKVQIFFRGAGLQTGEL